MFEWIILIVLDKTTIQIEYWVDIQKSHIWGLLIIPQSIQASDHQSPEINPIQPNPTS